METDSHDANDQEPGPAEYRIAIADRCGTDFRKTVLESGSNSDSAIYFRKPQLKSILATFQPAATLKDKTAGQLRATIRAVAKSATAGASPPTPRTPTGKDTRQAAAIAPDGGLAASPNRAEFQPQERFSYGELELIADVLGVEPESAYPETEFRKLAGSSIAGPYLAGLLEKSHVDYYLSVDVGWTTAERGPRAYYPYRMAPIHEIPQSAEDHPNCLHFVVDSSIQNSEYGNEDALDTAARIGADAAVLADEYRDLDGTVEAILDGIELFRKHEFEGEIVIPLQPPHDECYRQLRDRGVSSAYTFALGGLKDEPDDKKKIAALQAVRDVANDPIDLHGLGFGASNEVARAIRDDPTLLDSIDSSTPLQDVLGRAKPGEERQCTVAAETGAGLVESLRRLSPLVDDPANTTLDDFGSVRNCSNSF